MIHGVAVRPLQQIPDERGKIMPMLCRDDSWFKEFGEIYFSMIYPGVVKGWHLHKTMALNYAVVSGMIKLVLYDARSGSPTRGKVQEIFTGEDHYALVTVPYGVWNGFKGMGVKPAIVANCATLAHDPKEITRLNPFSKKIPYDWALKHS